MRQELHDETGVSHVWQVISGLLLQRHSHYSKNNSETELLYGEDDLKLVKPSSHKQVFTLPVLHVFCNGVYTRVSETSILFH
jgi:hypothetical protein